MKNALVALLLVGCAALVFLLARGPVAGDPHPTKARTAVEGAVQRLGGEEPAGQEATAPDAAAADPGGSGSAGGQRAYYQYVDASGTVHFVDSLDRVPPDWRDRAGRIELAVRPPTSPGEARRTRDQLAGPKPRPFAYTPEPDQPPVVVYTTTWCGWCRRTLAHLDRLGVRYDNHDVERDDQAAERLRTLTGSNAVPVLEIGNELVRGYDAARIDALLGG